MLHAAVAVIIGGDDESLLSLRSPVNTNGAIQ